MGERTWMNEMTTATELEDKRLSELEEKKLEIAREEEDKRVWDVEEKILEIDENSWKEKQKVFESAHTSVRHKEDFLRKEEKVSRQREKHRRNREEFMRRKEKRVEEVLPPLARISFGSEGQNAQQLLPGIPNETTLDHITTKLSWTEVHVLKSVSPSWYSAIRNQSVYDARVRSHSTQTFVLLRYSKSSEGYLPLHCWRGTSCFVLPRIPYHDERNSSHQSVAVNGKVYVLGGLFSYPSDKVYMLDLAGKRPWTQVASMHTARANFGCGVVDGKIYVFGGDNYFEQSCGSEVYDPTENQWSLIMPKSSLTSLGCDFEFTTVGEEFFLHGVLIQGDQTTSRFLEIYNPAKDEWRTVEPFTPPPRGIIFAWEGKACSVDNLGIHLYSFAANSWTQVCSHSFPAIEFGDDVTFFPFCAVVVVEDYLLAFGSLSTSEDKRNCILRSIGFDPEKKELGWREEIGWALGEVSMVEEMMDFMCPIHL